MIRKHFSVSKFCSHDLTFFGIFVNVKLGELKRVQIKIVVNIKRQDGDECYGKEKDVTPNRVCCVSLIFPLGFL